MTQQIPCQTCGEMFTPRTSGGKPQVRCSAKCRRKVANATYIRTRAPEKAATCAECGISIIQLDQGRPRRFCSDECKAREGNRRQNRRRQPPVYGERSCERCGAAFIPKRKDRIYCSSNEAPYCAILAYQARKKAGEPLRQGEQTKKCTECGTEFTTLSYRAKWCSKTCQIRENSRIASRRRGPARVGDESYSDRQIFERDNWICQICFSRVDLNVSRTDPEGATIDHVTPLVRGGLDAPSNVVTAHWRCNREKWIN